MTASSFTFTAYTGQKVACINARRHRDWPRDLLVQDRVYTVAAIAPTGGLYLVEAPWEAPYARSRFRPVRTTNTETGMGMLRPILDNPEGFTPTPSPEEPKAPVVPEVEEVQ